VPGITSDALSEVVEGSITVDLSPASVALSSAKVGMFVDEDSAAWFMDVVRDGTNRSSY